MSAVISDCGLFRYRLDRDVQPEGIVAALIGVNPSYADDARNDPTIRKDIGFGLVNGWRKIIKGNVFAFRSTKVRRLSDQRDPIGPQNLYYLKQIIDEAEVLVPCWGNEAKVPVRLRRNFAPIMTMLVQSGKPVLTFGLTKNGSPKHPLMLAYSTPLIPWKDFI